MDIEGYEIPWLESLSIKQLQNISQLTIEFHRAFSQRESNIFKKLNKIFALVHLHGNNYTSKLVNGIPYYFECTYINKKFLTKPLEYNTDPLPSIIDQPNIPSRPDLNLNFEPYVYNKIVPTKLLKLGPRGFY